MIYCCKDCVPPKRHPGCQSSCTDYAIDKAFHDEEMAARRKKQNVDDSIKAKFVSTGERIRRIRRKRR